MVDSDTGTLVRHCDLVMRQGCYFGYDLSRSDTSHNNSVNFRSNTITDDINHKPAGMKIFLTYQQISEFLKNFYFSVCKKFIIYVMLAPWFL